ncbi:FAD/NAD(P)-binding protein [Alteromonas sp. ASW11-130]|uniref:FAD/NAD(P)-binding protein n=1 Tax=Alteromonas sp. ASW11-130 TaxID=3015775 RepID=UPI002241AD0F|nr:FAD/NAD(P)-binding protein [Alteromonas sp. ASW11-130]MCW8092325.1 FAD/NAD(P)-binding protein [Alteromonas sp. ASW11-130]
MTVALTIIADKPKIAVIGAGASTVYLLHHLLVKGVENIDIDIFEANDWVGCGYPYNRENSAPYLLSNLHPVDLPPLGVSFTQYNIVYGGNIRYQDDEVITRKILGEYLTFNFYHSVNKLLRNNVTVSVLSHHKVTTIHKHHDSFSLMANGQCFGGYKAVVNNAGLGSTIRPHSPYPVCQPANRSGSCYRVVGSSLTAIDTILALAAWHGEFIEGDNTLIYIPHRTLNIKALSPSGVFPSLWYPSHRINDIVTEMRKLCSHSPPRIEALYQRVCLPFFARYLPYIHRQIQYKTFSDALAFLSNTTVSCDAKNKLRIELVAYSAATNMKEISWQEIIDAFLTVIDQTNLLEQQDMLRQSVQKMQPLIAKALAALPVSSAVRLLALINANCLSIKAESVSEEQLADSQADKLVIDCRSAINSYHSTLCFGGLPSSLHAVSTKETQTAKGGSNSSVLCGTPYSRFTASLPGLTECNRLNEQVASSLLTLLEHDRVWTAPYG